MCQAYPIIAPSLNPAATWSAPLPLYRLTFVDDQHGTRGHRARLPRAAVGARGHHARDAVGREHAAVRGAHVRRRGADRLVTVVVVDDARRRMERVALPTTCDVTGGRDRRRYAHVWRQWRRHTHVTSLKSVKSVSHCCNRVEWMETDGMVYSQYIMSC